MKLAILARQGWTHPAVKAHHPLLSSWMQEVLLKMSFCTGRKKHFLHSWIYLVKNAKVIVSPHVHTFYLPCFVLFRPDLKEKGWHPTRGRRDVLESTNVPSVRGSGWVATRGPTWDKNVSNATSTSIHTNRYFCLRWKDLQWNKAFTFSLQVKNITHTFFLSWPSRATLTDSILWFAWLCIVLRIFQMASLK